MTNIHHSSASDEWATPDRLFQLLDREFGFTLDAAATSSNAKCARFFTEGEDGLRQNWGAEVVWCNPPYSNVAAWVDKTIAASVGGATVVLLVASRTDTRWYQTCLKCASEARLLQGKVRFGGSQHAAPFPSTLFVFRPGTRTAWSSEDGGTYLVPRKRRHTFPWTLVLLDTEASDGE